jgi:hypothetical protein
LTWEEAVKRDLRDSNVLRYLALDRTAWKSASCAGILVYSYFVYSFSFLFT